MNDVTTNAYRAKLAQAVAGTATLPKIATVVAGIGGLDVNGAPIVPSGNEGGLYHQVLSKAAPTPTFPTSTTAQFVIMINPGDLPAATPISEVGLFDSSGDFAAISTFYDKKTDGTTTMTFQINMQL